MVLSQPPHEEGLDGSPWQLALSNIGFPSKETCELNIPGAEKYLARIARAEEITVKCVPRDDAARFVVKSSSEFRVF